METKIIYDVALAAAALKNGQLVGFPTETVYGLAANALDPVAVANIFTAKGRPQDNPLIVHIADLGELARLCRVVPEAALKLAAAFWPGPLTMVLPKQTIIPEIVSAGLDTVAVRMPELALARELILACGLPLAAPSANLSGRPSTTTAAHVFEDLQGKIPYILDGGSCRVGLESTVVDLCGETPRLLRPGGITAEELREILGDIIVDKAVLKMIDDDQRVHSPGMKYKHYAPRAKVTVFCGDSEKTALAIKERLHENCGVLCFDPFVSHFSHLPHFCYGASDDYCGQAALIFDGLRFFDKTAVCEIFAQCPPDIGVGLAVANRLKKAAAFHIITV